MKVLNILSIEDSENDHFLIQRKIKLKGVDAISKRVETAEEIISHLTTGQYDIILSDNSLPQMNAMKALKIVREIDADIPFIIVSGAIGENTAVEAMKAGANDYVMKDNLERLVPALLRELKEAENRRQKQELEADLQTLIYRSSHDLQGPIASIKGILELMKHEKREADIDPSIGFLEESTERLETSLHRLLEIFRIKHVPLNREELALEDLLRTILEEIRFYEGFKNVQVRLFLDDGLLINTIVDLLKSILINLLENAIKYRDLSKRGIIDIHAYAAGKNTKIVVRDNGIGIAKNVIDSVFNIFFRGTESSKGSGIGLYITKKAVEKLNGSICLISKENTGTLFKISIPSNL